ncbi:MAG: hypothetical protein JW990_21920 [Thermoleophilia bacterium]|nr:hypothetical protein [Thermoleophilia bacterium]
MKMKLIFRKSDEEQISVWQSADGEEKKFSYSEMINTLIRSGELESPETIGDFTEDEKKSISSMVERINAVLNEEAGPDEAADPSEK